MPEKQLSERAQAVVGREYKDRAAKVSSGGVDSEKRTVTLLASSFNVCEQDGIAIIEWDLRNFEKNPVVLEFHDRWSVPVASATTEMGAEGLMATFQFPEVGRYERSDIVFNAYEDGRLNAASVSFRVRKVLEEREDGSIGVRAELKEISCVPVPADPDAVVARMDNEWLGRIVLLAANERGDDMPETEIRDDELQDRSEDVAPDTDAADNALPGGTVDEHGAPEPIRTDAGDNDLRGQIDSLVRDALNKALAGQTSQRRSTVAAPKAKTARIGKYDWLRTESEDSGIVARFALGERTSPWHDRANEILGTTIATNGVMSTVQEDSWLEIDKPEYSLLPLVERIRMPGPTFELNDIEVGSRKMRLAVEDTDPGYTGVTTGKRTLTSAEVILANHVSDIFFEDAFTGSAKARQQLDSLFRKAWWNDLEDSAINCDDVTNLNTTFLGMNKGWIYLAQAAATSNHPASGYTWDANTDLLDIVFPSMVDALPEKYQTGELVFLVNPAVYRRYIRQLKPRYTDVGDRAVVERASIPFEGIPVVPVNKWPTSAIMLTDPKNLVIGVQRGEMRIEFDRLPKQRATEMVISARVDFEIRNPGALVVTE